MLFVIHCASITRAYKGNFTG